MTEIPGRHGLWLKVPDEVPAVRQLEQPATTIIREIKTPVLNDVYGVIVGDDTSGRVPALLVRYAINALRERHCLAPLPLQFLPGGGGRDGRSAKAQEALDERADVLRRLAGDRRVLLVTDHVQSGSTIVGFATGLRALGIDTDIAAMAVLPRVAERIPDLPPGCRLFVGCVIDRPLAIDGAHHLSGVNKFWTPVVRRDVHSRENMIGARWEARRVADAVVRQLGD